MQILVLFIFYDAMLTSVMDGEVLTTSGIVYPCHPPFNQTFLSSSSEIQALGQVNRLIKSMREKLVPRFYPSKPSENIILIFIARVSQSSMGPGSMLTFCYS